MATSSLLRGSVRLAAPARLRRCARSAVRVAAAAEDKPELVATSVTLTKLKESAGGKMTKNVDGALLSLSYDASTDSVAVEDPRLGVRFPATVGKDTIIRFDPAAPTPTGFGAVAADGGMEALIATLQLGALRLGPEVINGRAAMVGFLGVFLNEIATGRSIWGQFFGAGFFSAVGLMAAVSVASVAPLITGAVPAAKVFPSETDSYANERLPETWTPTAEMLNGRVAMGAILLLLLEELFTGRAVF